MLYIIEIMNNMNEINFPFILHGHVEHGKKLGRKLDMPTANIVPIEDISRLKFGVYYSSLLVEGRIYKSITNVGCKPTVNDSRDVNVESFIYDFEGDIYNKDIVVTLYEFKRPEMKFESIEALSKQMHDDLEAGKSYNFEKF